MFTCSKCGRCCKDSILHRGMVIIYPCEVARIAEHLECSRDEFLERFCRKEHFRVAKKLFIIYTLKKHNRQCIFLQNNLCKIYSFKPIQCDRAPYGYFAQTKMWKHLPCITMDDLKSADSSDEDMALIEDLMKGY